jgi:membrane protease YdiL (CAAX protease family)
MTDGARRRIELAALLAVGIAPFYLNGFYNWRLARADRFLFWSVEVFTWIVMPAVLLFVGWRRGLYSSGDLGLSSQVRGVTRPWLLALLFVGVPFAFLRLNISATAWAYRTLPSGWPLPPFRYVDVIPPPGPDTGWYRLLALLHLCITAGAVEESYYRGVMDQLFPRGWLGGACYVVASSVIFAGSHWEGGLPILAMAFAVGVFAASIFRLTGNLWPLIVGHIIADWYWLSGLAAG